MKNRKEQVERRKHERIPIKEYLLISNSSSKNGPVIDISIGGLAFHYSSGKSEPDDMIKFGTLIGSDFSLREAQLEMVAVKPEIVENTVVNRCSVKFATLSAKQEEDLLHFIMVNAQNKREQEVSTQ